MPGYCLKGDRFPLLQEHGYRGLSTVRLQGQSIVILNFIQLLEDLTKGLLKRHLRLTRLIELFYKLYQFVITNSYSPVVLDTRRVQQALYFIYCLLKKYLSTLLYGIRLSFILQIAIIRRRSNGYTRLRTTVV